MSGVTMEQAGKAFTDALSDTFADLWLVAGSMGGQFIRDKVDSMIQCNEEGVITCVAGKLAANAAYDVWLQEYFMRAKKLAVKTG